jgi:penicillin-binding protein 1C
MKLFAFAVPFCSLAAALALYFAGIDLGKIPTQTESVTYTDRNGGVLGTVLGPGAMRAASVPLAAVSPAFLDAIVAAEDARFWHHGAIDVPALVRAARDFAIYGEARSGGSTITMQLARLLHPTPSTIRGKLEQIWEAERIAVVSAKPAILEAYVNRVPMGGNVYGVEAAARTYFGEPAADLDLAQATLLASIPNDPDRLAPDADWSALKQRQRFVLQRMVALGEIDRATADLASGETLHIHRHEYGIADAAHALFFLSHATAEPRARVRTTIDESLQRFVQAQTQDVVAALQRYHVTDGAALVVDNRSGDVLAYVGSPDYFSEQILGRNDGVQALRQPGSSLKPFTYELALERGTIRSTSILADAPAAYALPGGKLYQPADYSGRFSGPVRVRYALANSLNAPAVAVLSALGVPTLLERLHALRFAHLNRSASYYGLGLTLGSGEVSLWELVGAYATLARSGEFIPLRLVAGNDATPQQIGRPEYWQLVADMLADPYARAKSFGIGSVLQMPFPAAVKTGTSSDFRDTWTVGFTADYTVGTWVGNFDGSPMRGVSGVTGAGPLWNRIMLHLYDRRDDPPPFPTPRGFVRASICATTGHAVIPDGATPHRVILSGASAASAVEGRPCSAIVQEWVSPRDLPALQPRDVASEFRILFPQDGDVFVRNETATPLQRQGQQLALRASDSTRNVRWRVAGSPLALDAAGNAFWPLRLGTWHIEADDGSQRDRLTIRVVRPRPASQPGFSYVSSLPLVSGAQRNATSRPSAHRTSAKPITSVTP